MKANGNWGKCHWELYDWGLLAIEGGLADGIEKPEQVPWKEHLDRIESVSFEDVVSFPAGASLCHMFDGCVNLGQINFENLNTAGVVNMTSMFEGCEKLKSINLGELDTSNVVSMLAMFMNCESLEKVVVDGLDTSNVEDMSWMFCGCEKLKGIELSSLNTSKVKNMSHMFQYCANLRNINLEQIDMSAVSDATDMFLGCDYINVAPAEEKPVEDPDKGLIGRRSRRNADVIEPMTFAEPEPEVEPELGAVQVRKDGSVHTMYAGAPIFIGAVEQIPAITYGQRLELRAPQFEKSSIEQGVELFVEISPDGESQWTPFDPNMILPANASGCYIRYKARNFAGTNVSDSVRITIRKADYDMTNVRWKPCDNPIYDGGVKSVGLIGLPEGLKAVYYGNQAIEAGEHIASANWEYDETNFNCPPAIEDFLWKIHKADFSLRGVKWAYNGSFTYDGQEHEVVLEGLPEGVTPIYKDNLAVDVGRYYATVQFAFDTTNFNHPGQVMSLPWEICKADVDMTEVKWGCDDTYVYDGVAHEVYLDNVPDNVIVHYYDNKESECGKYVSSAIFEPIDRRNYNVPESTDFQWEIVKATYDMSQVKWNLDGALEFDGSVKTISLEDVPRGLSVQYIGNQEIDAGEYEARARFIVLDENIYNPVEDMTTKWCINKIDYDLSDVYWTYVSPFVYDGGDKRVELVNLPGGITAEYTDNAAINAGKYTAAANLRYDTKNYNQPTFPSCDWQIMKTDCDVSSVYWVVPAAFEYDGNEKKVYLAGLPDNVSVEYTGNAETNAGEYFANVKVSVSDPENYNIPAINGTSWRIVKSDFKLTDVAWDYRGVFEHDGTVKSVKLMNVPKDFDVVYAENEAVDAGEYTAVANFVPVTGNYETPEPMTLEWAIVKGTYDLKHVRWNYTQPLAYNGMAQEVELVGLPDGVIATYTGNVAREVGKYAAKVKLTVTQPENYHIPHFSGINWEICKTDFDMSQVNWDYTSPFNFDGTAKVVELVGLPDGLQPKYTGNIGTEAAEYFATVSFEYDEKNYNQPEFPELKWAIRKGEYNVSNIRWDYIGPFTYDGQMKMVELVGYRGDISVRYVMNKAIDAGVYEAEAYLTVKDGDNYEQPQKMTLSWEIKRASFDMSNVIWSYDEPLPYNGLAKVVSLYNLPEGVWAEYDNNVAVDVGKYEANAKFGINNSNNYVVPGKKTCQWEIVKAELDMTRVHWDFRRIQPYNGKEQTVELVGLPAGITPIYRGNSATNAGMYDAAVDFVLNDDWNYEMPRVEGLRWEIGKADYDMSSVRWTYNTPLTYDGTEQEIVLEGLPKGVRAEYYGNIATDAGVYVAKAKLTVDDPDNFNAPVFENCKWRIKKADYDMSRVRWTYTEGEFIYDGCVKTIQLEGLPAGVTAIYSGNSQARAGEYLGMVYFNVENPNNYNIPAFESCRWSIKKGTYDMGKTHWSYFEELTYDGREKRVRLLELPQGVTATYTGNAGTNAGSYIATAALHVDADNYEIPFMEDLRWVIAKADPNISNARWDYTGAFTYDGKKKSVNIVGLPQGIIVNYRNNTAVGAGEYVAEAEIIVDDMLNYNTPQIAPCHWSIEKADFDMSRAQWIQNGKYIHDGEIKSVALRGLPEGVVASYVDNAASDVGNYVAKAHLSYDRFNYNEPVIADYKWSITKSKYDMSAVTWNYIGAFTYDGEEKRVELIGLPDGITPIYENSAEVNAGNYEATVRFEYDALNYEEPVFESCNWTIKQAEIDLSHIRWSYSVPFVYDGTEHSVDFTAAERKTSLFGRRKIETVEYIGLPEGMQVEFEGNIAEAAGKYTAKAIITPEDTVNYVTPRPLELKWEIRKADPDMSHVEWTYASPFEYDGKEKKIRVTGLPDGVSVAGYTGNTALEVGVYTARVEFKVAANGNFNQPEGITLRWKIEKKNIDLGGVRWTYHDTFEYDGTTKTIELENLPKEISASYVNNTAVEPGTYVAKAILIYDQACYKVTDIPDCRWKIEAQ